MKRYLNLLFYFWLFFECHYVFVNAYLKTLSTCIIVDNRCLFNQLAPLNSYCYEENTSRIYKTNIQKAQLKKREDIFNDNDKNEQTSHNNDQYKKSHFNYYRKNDRYTESRKKKHENKFLSIFIEKVNDTVPLVYPVVNSTYISIPKSEENNKNIQEKNEEKFEIYRDEETEDEKVDDHEEIIDYQNKSARVSLIQRSNGLEDYSSELCKIDYDNFSKKGVYFFDYSNRLVNSISDVVKTIYICQKDDATSCYLPKEDGFYLNTFQKEEIIEISGIKKPDTDIKNIIPEDGYSYINSEMLPKTSYKFERDIIKCNYDTIKQKVLCDIVDGSDGSYYIQKKQNTNKIIECNEGECLLKTNNILNGFYINSAASSMNNTLIYCFNDNCSFKIAENEQYYIGIQHNKHVMIECNDDKCFYNNNKNEGYYINSGLLIEDNDKPMIYCDSLHKCNSIKIHYHKNAHFISGAHTGHLISCRNDTFCEEDSSLANVGYYIDRGQDEVTPNPKLIYCYDQKVVPDDIVCKEIKVKNANQEGYYVSGMPGYLINYKKIDNKNYILIHSHPEAGFYLNNGDDSNGTLPLIYCEGAPNTTLAVSCITIPSDNGYYLMQSSKIDIDDNLYTQLIFCENSKCQIKDPIKGYFKYALDDELIISCNGHQCYLMEPEDCQATTTPRFYSAGNCCIFQSQMYLITEQFNITSTTNGMEFEHYSIPLQPGTTPKYAYFEVNSSEFPGMTMNSGSLYKISNYSITYFPYDDYFILTNDNEQLTSLNTTITEYDIDSMKIFNCDSSIESCIPEVECSTSKFILYEPLKLGMKCTNFTLEILTTEGNYLDGKYDYTYSFIILFYFCYIS